MTTNDKIPKKKVTSKNNSDLFQKTFFTRLGRELQKVINKNLPAKKKYNIEFMTITGNLIFEVNSNSVPTQNEIVFFQNTLWDDHLDYKTYLVGGGLFTEKQIDKFTEENRDPNPNYLKDFPFRIASVHKLYSFFTEDEENDYEDHYHIVLEFIPDYYNNLTSKILTEKAR